LNKRLPVPLYYQLKEVIQEQIENGELKPSDQLPTEDELVRQFEVSKTTVRQALRELALEGFLKREQGRGTFVATAKIDQGPRELTSFTLDMHRRGLQPGSKVLDQKVIEVDGELREKLRVAAGDPVFCLRRLRLADGEPMGIQTAYVPLGLCPGIAEVRFEAQSLYGLLEERYRLVPAYAQEVHTAVGLGKSEARLLKVVTGFPALAVERQTFLPDGRPLEVVFSLMRGDKYHTLLHLRNPRLSV
jgi:GntR family transcriptional regulator